MGLSGFLKSMVLSLIWWNYVNQIKFKRINQDRINTQQAELIDLIPSFSGRWWVRTFNPASYTS